MMKDLLLIDIGLLVNFKAKKMDINNYFHNQLLIIRNGPVFIPKEVWIGKRQNLEDV